MMKRKQLPKDLMLSEVSHMLDEGRDVVILTKGQSMLPFIRGDVDSVLLRKSANVKVGDIVLAYFEGRYVLHRVVNIDGSRVTLMGDGVLQATEQGDISEVSGKVVEIISPKGRHRKPTKGRLWRWLLPIRKYLLKIDRKLNKWLNKGSYTTKA